MATTVQAMRQVHLDFHTSPLIPDVGADWDAAHFARTLQDAGVQSVNLFAKCHHGMNYYPSKIGPVHPALTFDLLGEQIAACHGAGIRGPIYVSVMWDVSAAQRHPEWRQVTEEGRLAGNAPLDAGWGADGWPYLCLNTGYAEELLAQTEELLSRYDCDGFWYDILWCAPGGCLCSRCLPEMRQAGLDPAREADRTTHNHAVVRRFMARASGLIRERAPDADIFYNGRPWTELENEHALYTQVEVESLPTGGWGYGFFPLWSRYGRRFGKPLVGMTGRFAESWADWGGLKHPDALRYECGTILAAGGAVSVGDQMHPRGRLNRAVYDVIGEAFRDLAAAEEHCLGAEPVAQVGLLMLDGGTDGVRGAGRMLLELHHQYDLLTPGSTPDFGHYDVLVVPDTGAPSPETAERLRQFVAGGGRLLVSHNALREGAGGGFLLADALGVDYTGPAPSVPDYFQVTEPALCGPAVRAGFSYCLYAGPNCRVTPRPGTRVLASAYATYFNRTWEHSSSHRFTPPLAENADYPAITQSGSAVYIYGPIFAAYETHGNITFRALVGRCLDLLLPRPVLQTDAPATAEVSLLRQGGRRVAHIVNYHAQRRATPHIEALEAPTPLRDVALRLRCPEPVRRVHTVRGGADLSFQQGEGVVHVLVPRVLIHEMVVFETV